MPWKPVNSIRRIKKMSMSDSTQEVLTCECGSPGHIAIIELFEWKKNDKIVDVDVSFHINFNPDQSIWMRIWHAIKYVFNHHNSNDGFGDIILNEEKIDKIISLLSKVKSIKENMKSDV
jgi:hypothetical protein